ncbi:hypothetical protein FGG51_gp036 [Mycobacterium phage Astro]|uniref:Uncharacterized protein n=2 Tax=Fromanvirus astro TaxID=1195075 RepID=I6RA41_9CAUD|nr:hypothetical protein AVT31_gp037 [Mycobacterium phage Smeadley]YP_009638528.1 hypothetical protein FGG51_gp036 [Mycobacterium phage Astro]AXQ63575.1 hypothetical protein SEA_DIXON_69 [Mycobacterium phage Dixon]AYD86999.1 hypothetical protein SEA_NEARLYHEADLESS_70 [Mycobacterium phage NearlyHeadless]QBI96662.1 hypothetical protein SEA_EXPELLIARMUS_67 [Mycobacterium phage Expelliarmus]QHB36962.1 hypothetical protein SEA_ROARY_71 [Mycobacterium phage Roary]QJD50173.1 hypothetical protein SEA_
METNEQLLEDFAVFLMHTGRMWPNTADETFQDILAEYWETFQ